jgi:hypothetical protein
MALLVELVLELQAGIVGLDRARAADPLRADQG